MKITLFLNDSTEKEIVLKDDSERLRRIIGSFCQKVITAHGYKTKYNVEAFPNLVILQYRLETSKELTHYFKEKVSSADKLKTYLSSMDDFLKINMFLDFVCSKLIEERAERIIVFL